MIGYLVRIVLTMLWLAVGVFLLLALLSFTPNDPSWSHVSSVTQNAGEVSNLAGLAGSWIADILYTVFGVASWLLVAIAGYEAWALWRGNVDGADPVSHLTSQPIEPNGAIRALGYVFLLLSFSGLLALLAIDWLRQGVIGKLIGSALSAWFTSLGAIVFLAVMVLMTASFVFNIPWFAWLKGDKTTPDTAKSAQHPLISELEFEEEQTPIPATTDSHFASRLKNKLATLKASATKPEIPESTVNLQATPLQESPQLPLDFNAQNQPVAPAKPKAKPLDSFLQSVGLQKVKVEETPEQDNLETQPEPTPQPIDPLTKKLDDQLKKEIIRSPSNVALKPEQKTPNVVKPAFTITSPFARPASINQNSTRQADKVAEETAQTAESPELPVKVETPAESVKPFVRTPVEMPMQSPSEPVVTPVKELQAKNPTPEMVSPPAFDDDFVIHEFDTSNSSFTNGFANSVEHKTNETVDLDVIEQNQNTNTESLQQPSPSVMDLHNDILFQAKSRAMQTAAYRASLTPVPELSILDLPDPDRKPSYTDEQLQQMAVLLEIKLQEFNVKSTVVNAEPGPVVTRFEVELAPGIKASKVTGISRDLARSMSLASVRVVEVIPGKPYIGIEVPNLSREMVRLIELLDTEDYRDPKSHISMAMGKDIAGRPVITDLAKAPHMLVAGTTGSGKSVLVNSMLLSMLMKYTPEQLRMILIDPKQLELANYNDIPHLLTPVVTDMTEAASALSWCVAEMERRYQLMSLFKVRKLDEFNKKVLNAEAQGHPLLDPLWRPNDSVSVTSPPKIKTLPLIVIVADEFADMIMQVGKQAEELITRLAQKSRAAGIHLILATQRPSVDVITGLIKANIPARAGLRVNSKIDSRTILDAGGAEDMLGNGDMLFLGPGQIEPNRVHGAYVSDAEVNRVCDAWRERGSPDYIDNMFDNFDLTSPSGGGGDGGIATGDQDAFYDEAVAFVLETRKVSASSIQRKFSIGYNRAARLVDAMEEAGIVSPLGKNGKRELLM